MAADPLHPPHIEALPPCRLWPGWERFFVVSLTEETTPRHTHKVVTDPCEAGFPIGSDAGDTVTDTAQGHLVAHAHAAASSCSTLGCSHIRATKKCPKQNGNDPRTCVAVSSQDKCVQVTGAGVAATPG